MIKMKIPEVKFKVAQKQLEPPLLVPKDGYYLPLYTKPGSINFYHNGMADKIVPLSSMENIIPTELEQNQCRDAIFKAFYIDIFRMQKENKEMTAMEVYSFNLKNWLIRLCESSDAYVLLTAAAPRLTVSLLFSKLNFVYQLFIY